MNNYLEKSNVTQKNTQTIYLEEVKQSPNSTVKTSSEFYDKYHDKARFSLSTFHLKNTSTSLRVPAHFVFLRRQVNFIHLKRRSPATHEIHERKISRKPAAKMRLLWQIKLRLDLDDTKIPLGKDNHKTLTLFNIATFL